MTGLLEVAVAVALATFVVAWFVVATLGGRWHDPTSPEHRGVRAAVWLYAPFWAPLVVTGSALASGVAATLFTGSDHCASHATHHHHLCVLHPPHASGAWGIPLVACAVALPAVIALGRALARVCRDEALARSLSSLATPSGLGDDVGLVESDEPLAFAVGLSRPRVLVSTSLLKQISSRSLVAILAHERAHASRRDTLRAALDRVVATVLPARSRAALLREADLAREQLCDAVASQHVGDRRRVARALIEVVRLGLRAPGVGVSAGPDELEARVSELVNPASAPRFWRLRYLGALLLLCAVAGGPLHSGFAHTLAHLLH